MLALTATCTGAEGHAEDEAHVAFGGERNSGLGRFNGDWAIDEFTTDHTIGVPRL